ncbi:MAG: hypothetical protein J1F02_09840 [Lachnospiraceae bacterium]|nr:hypothetical protein [Lachnospiraceae bacterium]
MQNSTQALMEMAGITELFDVPHGRLQGSTVLASNGKEYLTVSQMINRIAYLIEFINEKIHLDKRKYSLTIRFLRSVQLVLNNRNADRPTKEQAHIITDVLHEVADMHAQSDGEKKRNEEIAVAIKCLIDILE